MIVVLISCKLKILTLDQVKVEIMLLLRSTVKKGMDNIETKFKRVLIRQVPI